MITNKQLLANHIIEKLAKVIYLQLLQQFRKEINEFNSVTADKIQEHLKCVIDGRLALSTIDTFEATTAKIKTAIRPEDIIADIILN